MQLYDLFSEKDLEAQIAAKMVKATSHPQLPLEILGYTQVAQYTPDLWNHVTDVCRGLIYNKKTLEIVARPFSKFWNYGDTRHPETLPENFPESEPTITRKLDGSLGIAYPSPSGSSIATRGSFSSEQALWATRWLRTNHGGLEFPKGWTALFEIIYPENQIVVKYDWSGLVLLSMVNIETGEEVRWEELHSWALCNGFRVVQTYQKPIDGLAREDEENEEGYVVSWRREGTTPLRCKIKFSTYCRLHKLLTQTNAISVWEMLRDGLDPVEQCKDVPEEFQSWLKAIKERLLREFNQIAVQALAAMDRYPGTLDPHTAGERKEFALYATQCQPLTAIMFAMLDGRNYAPIIWKMIRPRGDARVFKEVEE